MPSETQLEARPTYGRIDTRTVLFVYAAIAVVGGLSVTGTGVRGIPGMPLQHASIIWIAGMAIAAAGCAAAGLSLNEDPVLRRHSLFYFATGHLLLGLIVWNQWVVYFREQGLPVFVALLPLGVGIVLLITAMSSAPASDYPEPSGARIRSAYDEHIRQIARREERARLARDLHDAVKQQLFVIQTAAATAQARLEDDPAGTREALTQVRSAAREATTEMEALLDELQAAPMENTGLIEALKKQCEALALRTGADVRFEPATLPAQGLLPPGAHETIYRVAQEALANVARHARATRVTLSAHTDPGRFELRVADDGQGFDAVTRRSGMGISNMETRAAGIGGRISITSGPSGTQVLLSVPLGDTLVGQAWAVAAIFGLWIVSTLVFHSVRDRAPERETLWFGALAGAGVILFLVAAYGRRWRRRSR
jgi:signal transduction histidine kinase